MGKKTAAATTQTTDPESKIILERVSPKVLDTYLHKLKLDGAGSITDRVRRLAAFMRTNLTEQNAAVCDCGGRCDLRFEMCPFCGDPAVLPDQSVPGGDEATGIAEMLALRLEPGQSAAPAANLVQVGGRRRRRGEAAVGPDATSGPQVPFDPGTPPAELSGEITIAEPEGEGLPLVLVDTQATVETLNDSVAKIHTLVGRTFEASYDLGVQLTDCFTRKLWTQRRTDSGAPAYASWKDFIAAEIPGVSLGHGYKLMQIVDRFDRDAYRELGISKLLLMVRVPDGDDRLADVIESAPTLTLEQLKERVTEVVGEPSKSETEIGKAVVAKQWDRAAELLSRVYVDTSGVVGEMAKQIGVDRRTVLRWFDQLAEAGYKISQNTQREKQKAKHEKAPPKKPAKVPPPEPKKAAKAPPPEPKKKAPPGAPMLMVPMSLGTIKLPCFIRAKKRGDEPKRAKRLNEDPWCTEHMQNGVTTRYVIHVSPKGLELIVTRSKTTD